jgi:hypothetical protein
MTVFAGVQPGVALPTMEHEGTLGPAPAVTFSGVQPGVAEPTIAGTVPRMNPRMGEPYGGR